MNIHIRCRLNNNYCVHKFLYIHVAVTNLKKAPPIELLLVPLYHPNSYSCYMYFTRYMKSLSEVTPSPSNLGKF